MVSGALPENVPRSRRKMLARDGDAVARGQSNTSSAADVVEYWPRRWNLILPKEVFELGEPD